MPDAAAEKVVLEARARAADRVRELARAMAEVVEASESANIDDEHDPEGATIGFERAQLATLLDDAGTRLVELDAALDRLRNDSYGICEVCGNGIPPARLQAQPATTRCVACAARGTGRPVPDRRR